MNKINFYYEMKNFHNTPQEVKDSYYNVMSRVAKGYSSTDGGSRVLCILPTREAANRQYKKMAVETNYFYTDNFNTLKEIITSNEYSFFALEDILYSDVIRGQRFSDIRFLG